MKQLFQATGKANFPNKNFSNLTIETIEKSVKYVES